MARLCMQVLLFTCLLVATSCKGSTVCAPCGKYPVPYPLSTSSSCGHPLYPLTCTPEKKLEVNALSGNYTVQSLDPLTRTMVVSTGAFLGNSCITQDSVSAGNFSLFPGAPLFISPNNTVLFLNGSDMLKYSPLNCTNTSPCHNALRALPQKSCRSTLCCSLVTEGQFFRYGFPVHGLETAYVSIVDLVDSTSDASRWTYGLRLSWEVPREPPCSATHTRCGGNSTCGLAPPSARPSTLPFFGVSDPKAAGPLHLCLCNKGFRWDPITGTCLKAPYCVQNSRSVECHKAQYASGLTIGIIGLIALTALTLYTCKRRRAAQRAHARLVKERNTILAANSGGKSARLFSSKEMKKATNNFARNRVLGCGGFGEVYKGILDDKSVVAIKSAKIGNIKGIDQVLNEVRVLSQVNHRSLVRLLGCCVESELPLLVYEYVPNGNLYDHLASIYNVLDWRTRLQIGLQSAEGLSYLHSAAYPPIYHRDVKSSNILLDKSMNAKVSDFGLSRLAEPDLTHVSTCAQGTLGYLDPEYYQKYQLTDKSDVYSFGVVLLELVTSQKAIDFGRSEDDVSLAYMVQVSKEESRVDDVLDPVLVKGASKETVNSMRSVVDLALECLHESRLNRPSMKEVVVTLQQIISSLEAADQAAAEKNSAYTYKDVRRVVFFDEA